MTIQRGEIYFVYLNPVQGREQAGQRPVLVLSIDAINRFPLVITVVVGTKGENISRDRSSAGFRRIDAPRQAGEWHSYERTSG
jgi:mRNA-degrading endonuclease toxin of MazEF toxin-antitoxin module